MRYLATMLVAVCFFLNSLVGIVGTVVVCIHKDIVHISAAPNHCCSFYGNIHSGNSIGQDARCSAPSDCFDLLVGDGNSVKLASERMKLPQPTIFALSVPPQPEHSTPARGLISTDFTKRFFRAHFTCRTRTPMPLII